MACATIGLARCCNFIETNVAVRYIQIVDRGQHVLQRRPLGADHDVNAFGLPPGVRFERCLQPDNARPRWPAPNAQSATSRRTARGVATRKRGNQAHDDAHRGNSSVCTEPCGGADPAFPATAGRGCDHSGATPIRQIRQLRAQPDSGTDLHQRRGGLVRQQSFGRATGARARLRARPGQPRWRRGGALQSISMSSVSSTVICSPPPSHQIFQPAPAAAARFRAP